MHDCSKSEPEVLSCYVHPYIEKKLFEMQNGENPLYGNDGNDFFCFVSLLLLWVSFDR